MSSNPNISESPDPLGQFYGDPCPTCYNFGEVCATHGDINCPASPPFCEMVPCPDCEEE